MVFQTTLLVIMVCNLSLTSGSTYVMGSESLANSLQHIILKLMAKQSAQIKHLSSIFDASSVTNKMIGVIYSILQSLRTITQCTLLPRSHLSTPILVTILDCISWTSRCSHQILTWSNISIACNNFSPTRLHILRKLKPNIRPMVIDIVLRLHSRLVIGYGCYSATSRLLGHVIS
jgi:hypothetical protein